ncbi:hypothetical protein, partial [Noviherbaspirillum sp.]|uniref:hypothetical protein n=1 Tax=Noviherbaspirillum sp. TaxID=1926288 RepID=UPI002FE3A391
MAADVDGAFATGGRGAPEVAPLEGEADEPVEDAPVEAEGLGEAVAVGAAAVAVFAFACCSPLPGCGAGDDVAPDVTAVPLPVRAAAFLSNSSADEGVDDA